jgi:hypothetical protein
MENNYIMAKKKGIITPEKQKEVIISQELKGIKERIAWGITPKNPTRHFIVGQRIHWGAHDESYVLEVHEGGLYYKIISKNVKRDRDKPAEDEIRFIEWHTLFIYDGTQSTNFRKEEKHRLNLSNTSIDSLLSKVYHAGVDFDVEYQREHVWELEDKIALVDSIFNNIDIGKFVFVQRDFSVEDKLYEIIDGKQRLTAICEFYEDRFKYKGFYFSELSNADKDKFENHQITYGYLENPDKRAIFETFIKLNTCGKPMASKHIDKVKKLLAELIY